MSWMPGWLFGAALAATTLRLHVDASALCHADILVKDVDFTILTEQEKAALGPKLAKTLALQNGMGQRDIMSPTYQSGTVGFFSGSYVAPWSPATRKPYTGGSSTIVSALINGCEQADMVLGVLKNPAVHDSIANTVQMSLSNSGAITGTVTVLGVAVVPSTAAPPQAQATVGSASSVPLATMPDPTTGQSSKWLVPSVACLGVSLVVGFGAWFMLRKKNTHGFLQADGSDDDENQFSGH